MEKTNRALLLDLYRVATVDGNLSQEEQIILNNVCIKNGVHIDELMYILKNTDKDDALPKTEGEKFKYLFEIARLIIADGIIREEELYLFDRIAENLGTSKLLKGNIFRAVIDELIISKELQLKKLKNDLNLAYENKIDIEEEDYILAKEHKRMIKELIDGYKEGLFGNGFIKNPKIIILGEFYSKEEDIISTITNAFKKENINLDSKSFRVSIGYENIKNSFSHIKQSLEHGSFDYFLFGPHPHNLKKKAGTSSWEDFFKNTDIVVKGNYDTPLSKSEIKGYANIFVEHWKKNVK